MGGRRCWGEEGGRRYGDGGGSIRCWGIIWAVGGVGVKKVVGDMRMVGAV